MDSDQTLVVILLLLSLVVTFRYHPKFRKYRTGPTKRRLMHILNLTMMVLGGISGIAQWFAVFE